jgi:hypothetical protein
MACNNNVPYNKLVLSHEDSIQYLAFVQRAWDTIQSAKSLFKTGDLITRRGNDFTSESLRQLNQRNQSYSHCGIISIENDSIFVYHALGGEFNPDQKIRREKLKNFCEPYGNRGFGIFRYNVAQNEIVQSVEEAKMSFHNEIMFDLDFNLVTNDRMYCAEYVYKSYCKSPTLKAKYHLSHIKDFEFIGVDDLYLHPNCVEIKRFVYQ